MKQLRIAALVMLTALAVLSAACNKSTSISPASSGGPLPTPTPSHLPVDLTSGIRGTVVLSPACPGPVVASSPCPPRPLSADVSVKQQGPGGTTTKIHSAQDGTFLVRVMPGTYKVEVAAQGRVGRGASATVTVSAGEIANVTLTVDSGLR